MIYHFFIAPIFLKINSKKNISFQHKDIQYIPVSRGGSTGSTSASDNTSADASAEDQSDASAKADGGVSANASALAGGNASSDLANETAASSESKGSSASYEWLLNLLKNYFK